MIKQNKSVVITEATDLNYYIATEMLIPAADGEYNLIATVDNGEVTYSFAEGSGGSSGYEYVAGTTICDEVVTTEDSGDYAIAILTTFSGYIATGITYIVELNGTPYIVTCEDGVSLGDYTFQDFPFYIESGKASFDLYTATAGEYTILINFAELNVTKDFETAVSKSLIIHWYCSDSDYRLYKDNSLTVAVDTNEFITLFRTNEIFVEVFPSTPAPSYVTKVLWANGGDGAAIASFSDSTPTFIKFKTYA